MAYRLRPERPVSLELRGIADRQLRLAIADLRSGTGARRDRAAMSARRHIKKARAAVRLLEPALDGRCTSSDTHLRMASHLLAPVTDRVAVLETLTRVRAATPAAFPGHTAALIRATLVGFETGVNRTANLDRDLAAARRVLAAERRRIRGWTDASGGFRVIAPMLEHAYRKARAAMQAAARAPSVERSHTWRRRAKEHWFHMQLVRHRCGGHLREYERALKQLNEWLGENRNCSLLEDALSALVSTSSREFSPPLRAARHYQAALVWHAKGLARRLFRDPPEVFVERVRRLWHEGRPRRAEEKRAWPRAA